MNEQNIVLTPQDLEFLTLIRSLQECLIEVEVSGGNFTMVRAEIPESLDTMQPVQASVFEREEKLIRLARGIGYGKIVCQISKGRVIDLPYKRSLAGSFRTIKMGLVKQNEGVMK